MAKPTKSTKGAVSRYSISLTPEAAAKLAKYCAKHERPRSWVVDRLIVRFLEKLT